MSDMPEHYYEMDIFGFAPYIEPFSFKNHRATNGELWMTKERKELKIKDMETDHISNCMDMLIRKEQTDTKAFKGLEAESLLRTTN